MAKHPSHARAKGGIDSFTANSLAWTLFAPLLAVAGILIVALLPRPLILPAVSILMVTSGFALAGGFYFWGLRKEGPAADAWSIAGALVFLGFAAGILADGEEALAALEQMQAQRLANR